MYNKWQTISHIFVKGLENKESVSFVASSCTDEMASKNSGEWQDNLSILFPPSDLVPANFFYSLQSKPPSKIIFYNIKYI